MLQIPVEDCPYNKYNDADVISAWEWFISFLSKENWAKRKNTIESKIALRFRSTPPFSEPLTEGTLMVEKQDQIGWYLYLLDMLINEPHKYEFFQGARVVPIFKRFGINLTLLKSIVGIDKKIKTLLHKRTSEADALLFEMLTALAWARQGYEVNFLDEGKSEKTPDLLAKKGDEVWNIECKRQSKTADYTYRETAKRQIMINHISRLLLEKNIILNITFHTELEPLPDLFLKDLLYEKLQNPVAGLIVSNAQIDVVVDFVDIRNVRMHLSTKFVKYMSPMLNELIGKSKIDNKGFTSGMHAAFYRVGEGEVNNLFVADINHAYAVYWSCDAEEALTAKARDIKNQVFAAIKQLNNEMKAVVHIGLETFDGPAVERRRFEKIEKTIKSIDPRLSSLRWIFCHFFQSYSTPEEDWFFDETVSTMSAYDGVQPPVGNIYLVVPEDAVSDSYESHWERPLP